MGIFRKKKLTTEQRDELERTRTDKAIRRLPIMYAFTIVFGIGLALWAYDLIKTPEHDLLNASALVLEGVFAIIISWTVYVYSKKWNYDNRIQQTQISELISEIKKLEEKQKEMIEEQHSVVKNEKNRIARWKQEWGTIILANVESIKEMYKILEDWLNAYNENPSPQHKISIIESSKRNEYIVEFNIEQIIKCLPNIETYFEDPVLALNLKANCKNLLSIFQSLHMDHYWESKSEGTFLLIEDRIRVLTNIIERLKKEIPQLN
ncbi:hypothetical protein YTPLAS73_10460 [Nitrosarchaeum sp.]|nr:hypothetical protein YTPLAS73_10460 [Nitrosarchaeum sp.]